jgi:uncharacterized membrane protein
MRSLLRTYWNGDVPLCRVFWFDMLVIGTIINAVTAATALVAFATDAPDWLAVGIFLAPLPYNLLLCLFVWRSATRHPSRWSDFAKAGSVLWLVAALIV